MKKYEAVFILDIRKVDDEGVAFSNELTALIESLGGKMTEAVSMGRKQFTYEINKRKGGIYWNFFFELAPSKVLAVKEKFMLDERILRNMIIVDERPAVIEGEKIQEA